MNGKKRKQNPHRALHFAISVNCGDLIVSVHKEHFLNNYTLLNGYLHNLLTSHTYAYQYLRKNVSWKQEFLSGRAKSGDTYCKCITKLLSMNMYTSPTMCVFHCKLADFLCFVIACDLFIVGYCLPEYQFQHLPTF
jgi:hypothetical protein